jgi:uncharacterized membrane protein YczE
MKTHPFHRYNFATYVMGMLFASFGVFLMKNSRLGLGPWGVAALEFQQLMVNILPFFTFGMASAMHTYAMLLFVLIVLKSKKSFFIIISIFFLNAMVDTYDLFIFPEFYPTDFSSQVLTHIGGFASYVLGTSFIILTKIPGLVLEEFTFAVMKVFKWTSFSRTRVVTSYAGFLLAIVYSLINWQWPASLTVLSFFLGFAFGPSISFVVKWLKKHQLETKLHLVVD